MRAFSESLVDLYEAAISINISAYPAEMLNIVRQVIDFDGAVFGTGKARTMNPPDLVIENAHVINRDPAILDDYAQVSPNDPVTHRFVSGLASPLALDCVGYYKAKHDSAMLCFVQEHDINHLLLFGSPPNVKSDAEWLVLYRGTRKRFDHEDMGNLHALWPHLMRCISINRTHYLSSYLIEESNSGVALINRSGRIEVATPSFHQMLLMEWPDWQGLKTTSLPSNLLQRCLAAVNYQGSCINFVMDRRGDYTVCTARHRSNLAELTPTENLVLLHFASGLNHKKIAQLIGSSQNTIRSHIAHGYAKLGIHNKAALANLFSASSSVM